MTERPQQANSQPEVKPTPERPPSWQMGWTKHGTMCMTRGIRILNSPATNAEAFEQHGGRAA
jgi:hypothetical protein